MSLRPFQPLQKRLVLRKTQQLHRRLTPIQAVDDVYVVVNNKRYLNFASNDYLGIRARKQLVEPWQKALSQWSSSASASPMITGYTHVHQTLEETLCHWLGFEDAMLFSSGFLANQTVLFTLLNRQHTIWQDKLNHASLQEAGHMSPAIQKRFLHNNITHLTQHIQPASGLIVSEGVFSMDGNQATLPELVNLATITENALMIDDAHGLGVLGKQGQGTVHAQRIKPEKIDIYIGTFSKALGACGAFVAGKREIIETLRQFGRGYIYSTHISSAQASTLLAAIQMTKTAHAAREQLQAHIDFLRHYFPSTPLEKVTSPIIPVIFGSVAQTQKAAQHLQAHGIWCQAIRPPTVPKHTSRLRITLSAAHTKAQVQQLAHALEPIICHTIKI